MYSQVKRFISYIQWLYMQYLLNTALYMLEPAERSLFTGLLISLIVTAIYSTYVFLPQQLITIGQYMGFISNETII